MTAASATACIAPFAHVSGCDVQVPLVQGGTCTYANFDYAASAPALATVTERIAELLPYYASVHRGAGYASRVSTASYEDSRESVARFVGADTDQVVVFTRNTTDSLNLLAGAVPGDVVVLDIEHHANLLPWKNSRVVVAADSIAETVQRIAEELNRAPAALLAVTGASNVTGEVLPISELAALAHSCGARILVDGAQLVPHRSVDLTADGIDYLAFSGHKLYAPFGAGVLVGRRDWLRAVPRRWRRGARGDSRRCRMGLCPCATRGRNTERTRGCRPGRGMRHPRRFRHRGRGAARGRTVPPARRRIERHRGRRDPEVVGRLGRLRRHRDLHRGWIRTG